MKLLGFALTLAGFGVSWIGMIYGWGISPVSWPWIIGSTIGCLTLMGIGQAMGE